MSPHHALLDDYLGLLHQPLAGLRMMVFFGASGSGKSSQIKLLQRHPELAGRDVVHCTPTSMPLGQQDVVVLDEIQTLRDCRCLSSALRSSRLLLVASHVDPRMLWPWRFRVPTRCFRIDSLSHKLARAMRDRGIRFSQAALQRFVAHFGANYTDLDIVLEQAGVDDLDQALALFTRGGAIRHC